MISSQRFVVVEETQVGEARRFIQDRCRRVGASETFGGRAAIIVTELGRNLVRHAGGGEIIIRDTQTSGPHGFEVLGVDRGPGLRNVTECLRDGFSTIGTAGTGLGSIKRLSDRFDIFTETGKGTCLWSQLFDGAAPSERIEASGVSVALDGQLLCGDAWDLIEVSNGTRLLVADGLGHGPFASEAAQEAVSVFRTRSHHGVADTMEFINKALGKTRGAAAAIVEISPSLQQIAVSGIGNISIRVHAQDSIKSLVCDNGTLGVNARKVREYMQPFPTGALLILHSDGLISNWSLNDYPGLSHRAVGLIAGVLYRDFKRGRDDATIVTARYRP